MSYRIDDTDHGFKDLMQRFTGGQMRVEVGLPEAVGALPANRGDGVTLAEVGWWMELGTADGHVPARSWLRDWFDTNREQALRLLKLYMREVADGKVSKEQALEEFGLWAAAGMRKRIDAHIPPENAAATVRNKGFDHPLIDTQQLRDAITAEVRHARDSSK